MALATSAQTRAHVGSGKTRQGRPGADFYCTPPEATRALLFTAERAGHQGEATITFVDWFLSILTRPKDRVQCAQMGHTGEFTMSADTADTPVAQNTRRLIISGLVDQGGARRVITYSPIDPDGYDRWIPEADLEVEITRLARSGYVVIDERDPSAIPADRDPEATPHTHRDTGYTHRESGEPLVISRGIGTGGPMMVFRRRPNGSLRRVNSPALPERNTTEECLADLARWEGAEPVPVRAAEPAPGEGIPAAPPAANAPRRIPVSRIRTDGDTQVRAELYREIVGEYADAMRAGAQFPPILVYHDGTDYWLADGFHRLMATVAAGHDEVLAEVRPGTRRDAIPEGIIANSVHGLRLSRADKRHAVEMILADREWHRCSDRHIAEVLLRGAVSHTYVANIRRERYPQAPRPALPLEEESGNVATPAEAERPALNAALPTGAPARSSYPSERPEAPAQRRGPAPEAPDPDDQTPTMSVRHIARACLAAIQTYARTARGESPAKTQQAMEDIIAQHIQDAVAAATTGRLPL